MNDLVIKNLRVEYKKGEPVLDNFSLTVKGGELIVILGPSGCGKSTLLSAVSGIKTPVEGIIKYNDKCFFSKEDRINIPPEKRSVGFVFQSYALWPHMNVYQNISFALKARGVNKEEIRKRVYNMLDIVNMSKYVKSYPNELSGGEKQRVALARSLVYNPSLLLLDEPLANLDANLKTALLKEIKDIHDKLGVTSVYVTHDQNEAFEISDRVVILKDGIIMQKGVLEEIYNNSNSLFVANFIGKNNILQNKEFFIEKKETNKSVSIRPEDIILCENGKYKGTVIKKLFKGEFIEYVIESYNEKLLVVAPNDCKYEKGNKVSFNIRRWQEI